MADPYALARVAHPRDYLSSRETRLVCGKTESLSPFAAGATEFSQDLRVRTLKLKTRGSNPQSAYWSYTGYLDVQRDLPIIPKIVDNGVAMAIDSNNTFSNPIVEAIFRSSECRVKGALTGPNVKVKCTSVVGADKAQASLTKSPSKRRPNRDIYTVHVKAKTSNTTAIPFGTKFSVQVGLRVSMSNTLLYFNRDLLCKGGSQKRQITCKKKKTTTRRDRRRD